MSSAACCPGPERVWIPKQDPGPPRAPPRSQPGWGSCRPSQLLSSSCPHTHRLKHSHKPQTQPALCPQGAYGQNCRQEQGGEAWARSAFIGKEFACGLRRSPVNKGATFEPKARGFLF